MTTKLLTSDIWPAISGALRRSKKPCFIAVAYAGNEAAKRLPVPRGSCIVADISEHAVSSGQTCPAELLRLVKNRGARVYTVANLHAKAFVTDRHVFVGSTNVSKNSADTLLEAVVVSTDQPLISATKKFVRGLCLEQCGPEELKRLQKLYRPPKNGGGRRKRQRKMFRGVEPEVGRVIVVQTRFVEAPTGSESVDERGVNVARQKMSSPRRSDLDEYWTRGKESCRVGDLVIEVLNTGRGRALVARPGKIVHQAIWRGGRWPCTFSYIERPPGRRRDKRKVARRAGYGALKMLGKSRRVPRAMAVKLLRALGEG